MGKGSGGIDTFIGYVKKGKVVLEVKGLSKKLALLAFNTAQHRISIKMTVIEREVIDV